VTRYGTWVSYGGGARVGLALVLLAVAAGLAIGGHRLRRALPAPHPGRTAVAFLLLAWVLAIATFLVCFGVYIEQARHAFQGRLAGQTLPADPITPVTFTAVVVTFVAVLIFGSPRSWIRPVSAIIAALAAPLVFELPFDLVVMARTYPPIPPYPGLYRALFFLPLFMVEVTTLALLMSSPEVHVNRWTLRALAAMFITFAGWALFGFGYPASPIPIAANVVAKLLAFAATLTLFLPPPTSTGGQPPEHAATA